ncbi:four-carbon acid sugar kinase family protein [Flexithrix dorotheae]|uniref:four-carbon acid sugar kinase family protein n=1 Tax=Flexithrix dorotheae TaxID=70993 RepID=UPI000375447A|nr:four-carbon acid sugar kinase family protein [Flexithrix dorotheae]
MKLLHNNIWLSYYGDDFTGSTDVMETLAFNGIPTALFLKPPTNEEVSSFKLKKNVGGEILKAFGVAGISRSLNKQEMEKELLPVFKKISQIPTDFFHYKVCSTMDSAPDKGNIGRATELAERFFPSATVPIIIGAPFLNRFVIFGNLFARIGAETFRLDLHPVMANHPVTPMRESDIRRHLALQSDKKCQLFDLHDFELNEEEKIEKVKSLSRNPGDFLLFDTFNLHHLETTGALIFKIKQTKTQLLVGSSGINYALAKYLQKIGEIENVENTSKADKAEQIIVVAGSCSPITANQLNYAAKKGFEEIRIDVINLLNHPEKEMDAIIKKASQILSQNKSLTIFSAKGPGDNSIAMVNQWMAEHGDDNSGKIIGKAMGKIMKSLLEKHGKIRVVSAGGDTSGYVSRELGIYALETLCPIAPGAPLCVAHSKNPAFDGLEISLKGGQNGKENYFEAILNGGIIDSI